MSRLSIEQVMLYLGKIPGWKLAENHMALYRSHLFPDFRSAASFVGLLVDFLPDESYMPEVRITGASVTMTLTTHQVKGLTGKDFAFAQSVNKLLQPPA